MSEDQLNTVFGIDLGTTYSAVAYADEFGKPTVVANREGEKTTASVVLFEGPDQTVVGGAAKRDAFLDPGRVVQFVKRDMGHPDVTYLREGKEYTPEEISALILRKLASDAAEGTGEDVTDVVITVPAFFGDNERTATKNAGKLAGLNVLQVLNEPTAAALAYGLDQEGQNKTVLVYDLGGGTFDVTVIEIHDKQIAVKVTGGDRELGGKDWDDCLLEFCAADFMAAHGSDPREDPSSVGELRERVEQAKRDLSSRNQVGVIVQHAGQRHRVMVEREKFEELTAHLVDQTIDRTQELLEEAAQKGCEKFDEILLVGGSSRMPIVTQRLEQEYGVRPKLVDPDEGVAKGAAVLGNILRIGEWRDVIKERKQEEAGAEDAEVVVTDEELAEEMGMTPTAIGMLGDYQTIDVVSQSLGLLVWDRIAGKMKAQVLIQKNTEIPAEHTEQFGTVAADQQLVELEVVEGDSEEPEDCVVLGKGTLQIPPGLPRGSEIQVTYRMEQDIILQVSAVEQVHGGQCTFKIERKGAMSEEEVAVRSTALQQISVN